MKKIVKLIIGFLSTICPLMLFIILKNKLPFQFHLIIICSYVLIFIILSFILLRKYAKSTSLFITFSIITSILSGLVLLFWHGHCTEVDSFKLSNYTCCIEQHSFPQDELVIKVYKNFPYALHTKKINIKNNIDYDVSLNSGEIYISIIYRDMQTDYTISVHPFEINENGKRIVYPK